MKKICLLFLFFSKLAFSQTTLKGYVFDKETLNPLSNATIFVSEYDIKATTNDSGAYQLSLSKGTYIIKATFYGYETKIDTINIEKNTSTKELNIFLYKKEYIYSTILVEAEREKSNTPSSFLIRPPIAQQLPATGEYDILRIFTLLPGINQPNNLKSVFYVRGGSADQNQFFLDGVEIYTPSHLLGLFSSFNFYTISSSEVFTANFPVEYAHKLSSVTVIHTKDPYPEGEFKGSIGVFSSNVFYARKFGKFGFVVGARLTYLNLINKLIYNLNLPYEFYDGLVKLSYDLSKDLDIKALGFFGQDFNSPFSSTPIATRYKGSNTWGNRLGAIMIKKKTAYSLHKTSLSFVNHFKMFFGQSLTNKSASGFININLYDISGKYHGLLVPEKKLTVKWGIEYRYILTDYAWNASALAGIDEFFYVGFPLIYNSKKSLHFISVYAGVEWNIAPEWIFQASLRYTHPINKKGLFLPKTAIFWSPLKNLNLSSSFQLSSQLLAEGQEGTRISIGSPVFILDKPTQAFIATLGISYKVIWNINASLEGYIKYYPIISDLQPVRPFVESKYPVFQNGQGIAYGFDVFIYRHVLDGAFFQLAYSFQKAFISQSSIYLYSNHQVWKQAKDVTYPSTWAVEHAIKGVFGYRHAKSGWSGSIGIVLNSGRPTTPQVGVFEADRSVEDMLIRTLNPSSSKSQTSSVLPSFRTIPGEPNSISLPIYLLLDISLKKEFSTSVNKWTVYIQIKNVLNNFGTTYYNWRDFYEKGRGNVEDLIQTSQYGLPIFPSFGVECEF